MTSNCIEVKSNSNGYRKERDGYAHRKAWTERNGPIPEGMMVLHSCDNRACVNIEHLRIGTHADNMADMVARKRNRVPHPNIKGSRHPQARLSESDVRDIRHLHELGLTTLDLADRYGVVKGTIEFVIKRKTWAHVD